MSDKITREFSVRSRSAVITISCCCSSLLPPSQSIISLVIVGVAALNLLLDFDFIENGANAGLPQYFEWYGAFGIMVTLIWLYLEILRLLSMLSKN